MACYGATLTFFYSWLLFQDNSISRTTSMDTPNSVRTAQNSLPNEQQTFLRTTNSRCFNCNDTIPTNALTICKRLYKLSSSISCPACFGDCSPSSGRLRHEAIYTTIKIKQCINISNSIIDTEV